MYRLTGVSKKAVSRLMVDAGQAAAWYQDRVFRNLTCKRIQVETFVVHVDRYGNAVTGLRADGVPDVAVLVVAGLRLPRARTFGDVPRGEPFWYENSMGLVEIAVPGESAAGLLKLRVGSRVALA